jgi:hypothetical protein
MANAHQVCLSAVGVVSDVVRALGELASPYVSIYTPLLLNALSVSIMFVFEHLRIVVLCVCVCVCVFVDVQQDEPAGDS